MSAGSRMPALSCVRAPSGGAAVCGGVAGPDSFSERCTCQMQWVLALSSLLPAATHPSCSSPTLCRTASVYQSGVGWLVAPMTISKDGIPELEETVVEFQLHHKDLLEVLTAEYGNKEYVGHFVVEAKEEFDSADPPNRVYAHPHQAGKARGGGLGGGTCEGGGGV